MNFLPFVQLQHSSSWSTLAFKLVISSLLFAMDVMSQSAFEFLGSPNALFNFSRPIVVPPPPGEGRRVKIGKFRPDLKMIRYPPLSLSDLFMSNQLDWRNTRCILHYVLRVLKTCLWDPRCQTYVFKSQMGSKQSVVVATEWRFFQITFLGTKNHRKNGTVSFLINSPII